MPHLSSCVHSLARRRREGKAHNSKTQKISATLFGMTPPSSIIPNIDRGKDEEKNKCANLPCTDQYQAARKESLHPRRRTPLLLRPSNHVPGRSNFSPRPDDTRAPSLADQSNHGNRDGDGDACGCRSLPSHEPTLLYRFQPLRSGLSYTHIETKNTRHLPPYAPNMSAIDSHMSLPL